MNRRILITASFLGGTAVILGAFASHGLKKIVDIQSVQIFEIGVRYQMYHALFLLGVGCIPYEMISNTARKWIWICTIIGVVLFSGTIYGLATNEVSSFFDFKKIGIVTPMGGILLIVAWLLLLISLIKQKK